MTSERGECGCSLLDHTTDKAVDGIYLHGVELNAHNCQFPALQRTFDEVSASYIKDHAALSAMRRRAEEAEKGRDMAVKMAQNLRIANGYMRIEPLMGLPGQPTYYRLIPCSREEAEDYVELRKGDVRISPGARKALTDLPPSHRKGEGEG